MRAQPPLSIVQIFFISLCLIVLQNTLAIASAYVGGYFLPYPDAYMRLVKVFQFMSHHEWFNHFINTTNAPYGADLHCWTRALDILIALGGYVFAFFMPLKKALWIWAFILPPLFKLISIMLMIWALKPLEQNVWQTVFILIAFLFHPYIQTIYLPLRVDYNFLTTTLFIGYIGSYLRLITQQNQKLGLLLGGIFAIGSWVSLSFYIIALLPMTYLLLQWIAYPKKNHQQLSYFFVSALVLFLICIIIEHGHVLVYHFDILSFYYWILLAIPALAYAVCQFLTFNAVPRFILFCILVISMLILLFYIEPNLMMGPYANADPFWRKYIFPTIVEHISPVKMDKILFLSLMVNGVLALSYLFYSLYKNSWTQLRAGLFFIIIPLLMLSILMLRWNDYSQPIFILIASGWLSIFARYYRGKSPVSKSILMACISISLALAPFGFYQLLPHKIISERQKCLNTMLQFIGSKQFQSLKRKNSLRLLIEPELSPALLFLSSHQSVAGFYHSNIIGMKDLMTFVNGPRKVAFDIINKRHLDGFLLCPRPSPAPNSILADIQSGQQIPYANPYPYHSNHIFYFYTFDNGSRL